MKATPDYRVVFKKPDMMSLVGQYTVVDMHFHSRHSDGVSSVEAIAQRALDLGIGVSVTDHNEIEGAVEMERFKEVMSIPGIEVTSCEGTHVLVYFSEIEPLIRFFDASIAPHRGKHLMTAISLTMEEILEAARQFGGIVIFPHPYSPIFTGITNSQFPAQRLNRLLQTADGVEVINASNLKKWNLQSALLGFNLGKAITGGSDGHTLKHLGRAVCVAQCVKDRQAFLQAILQQDNRVIGKEIDLFRKMTSNGVKLKRNIRNTRDIVSRNLRYLNLKSRSVRDTMKRRINGKLDDLGREYGIWTQ